MPSRSDHISKAEHNERFAQKVDQTLPSYRDWAVTAYFYSALHYVEAYLATRIPPIHSPGHHARDDQVGRDPALKRIFHQYSELKNDSTNARYQTYTPSPIDLSNYVIPNHLAIKKYILSIIPT